MEDQIEINVEAKKLNEVLMSKRCSRHDIKKGKKAKRAKQKQQLRKEIQDESPGSFFLHNPNPSVVTL